MRKVLVVEDSPTQRELIKEFLKDMGYELIFAFDGVEALSLVKRECPTVVVLDIVMPRMNGYELCRQLKGNSFIPKPAVVFYSTKSEKCDFYWGLKQGADAYVSKLDRPQVLINTVEQLLQQAGNSQEINRVRMAKLESELIVKLKLLYSNLRDYKKAQSNPPIGLDIKGLSNVVAALEAKINKLEALFDACLAINGIASTKTALDRYKAKYEPRLPEACYLSK